MTQTDQLENRLREIADVSPYDSSGSHIVMAALARAVLALRDVSSYETRNGLTRLDRLFKIDAELAKALGVEP